MNVLFLTMLKITSVEKRGIYTDLLREFVKNEHKVYIVSPSERREKRTARILKENNVTILRVNTLNLQKSSLIEKGIGQLLLEYQFLKVIKENYKKIKFDLIVYNTPPITFSKVISYIKKRDNAYAYLLLKDIFPQNAIDLKMIKEKGSLHKFFLKKERKLYEISDKIGCMSPANKSFLLEKNSQINKSKVEINPNSISPVNFNLSNEQKVNIKKKYKIPIDKKIFIYGGNLGVPQGIDFLLTIIKNCKNTKVYFLIVGTGTEFFRIKEWFQKEQPLNAILINGLEKEEYDLLLASCDVGMIFLNKDFTIPNFPSRLLSYLEMRMPVFSATDRATDIGEVIEESGCGYSVYSGDIKASLKKIDILVNDDEMLVSMGEKSWSLLNNKYCVKISYQTIINSYSNRNV